MDIEPIQHNPLFDPSPETQNAFWSSRGRAIQAYAQLEQSLCQIFADISGQTDRIAAIVFFNIINTKSRLATLESLLKIKYQSEQSAFWKSVFKALKALDLERNKLVHWLAVNVRNFTIQGMSDAQIILKHPTFWSGYGREGEMTTDEINIFRDKCIFYAQALDVFSIIKEPTRRFGGTISDELSEAWHEIFRKPLIHPLPSGIQLPPSPIVHERPPRSSSG